MNLSRYPILRGLVPYIAGILLASFFPLLSYNYLIIIVLSIFLLLIISFFAYRYLRIFRKLASVPIFLISILLGFCLTNVKNSSTLFWDLQNNAPFKEKVAVELTSFPVKKEKTIHFYAKIYQSEPTSVQPLVLLYFKNDSLSQLLNRGDLLLVAASFQAPQPPKNPNVFDYKKFLQRKGISFTAYVDSHNWTLLRHAPRTTLTTKAHSLQSHFSSLFSANGLSGPEYSVITAILLGNDDTMDPELKSGYASAGVSHILCVSGMHVGIIYMILNFLMKPLDYSRRLRFLKSLLLVAAVWFYATLTGLAPSVQRSASMFTFVTLGGLMRRNVNIFHSLFASMFVLLLVNPLLIFEIGFEMSYLAVFGIVIFQPRLSSLFTPKTRIGRYVWELVCVSIAAQLSTFPLSIFYFGQFPNYFLLSNLSVMSLSFVVIVSGVVLLAVSWWPALAHAVGWILTYQIRIMNTIISTINSLPYSVTDHLSFSLLQTLLVYSMIVFLFLWIKRRSKLLKYCFLFSFVCLLFSFSLEKIHRQDREELTFYSIDRRTVVGACWGGEGCLLLDSAALFSSDWYDYHVKGHECSQGIRNKFVSMDSCWHSGPFYMQNHFLYFRDKTLYFLSRKTRLYPLSNPLPVDYLFVCDNAKISLSKLAKTFEIKEVIIGSNVSFTIEKRWIDSCTNQKIPVHSLRTNGYLTVKTAI